VALSEADRRLAHELAFGVLRLRGRLDHVVEALVAGGLARLEPRVLDALRLGSYQLLELQRVPAYAAVSDAVELAKAGSGRGAASLVNAVLRKVSGRGYETFDFPSRTADPAGHLSTWGSHPGWLVERWLSRWPADDVERLVGYNNSRPAVYLSAVGNREEAAARLREAGIAAEAAERAGSSIRVEAADVGRALARVPAVVQDPGAASVVDYMALDPGRAAIDLCAAPGGKASLLAARGHSVAALDVSRNRLARLLENRARLGLHELHVLLADSCRPPVRPADAVLLDAPCTGTGTLARHPDGRWRLGPADLQALVESQRRLLDAAARVVRPGGLLIYATCSLEPEENVEQVESFLSRHPDFGREPPPGGAVPIELLGDAGELRVLPQHHDMDGAYAARLRRRVQ
jgi:16S rRNA (cytosine967-C5)-methyltransferase